jgi:hypothetical protein
LTILNDSIIIGQNSAVDTTGYYGLNLAAYHMQSGAVVDSFTYLIPGESTYIRALTTDQNCVSVYAVELTMAGQPVKQIVWRPGENISDTLDLDQVDGPRGAVAVQATGEGITIYQAQHLRNNGQRDKDYNGVAWRYTPCGDLISTDTLFRDTIEWVYPIYRHYRDPSRYVLLDQTNYNLILLDTKAEVSPFLKTVSYADNEFFRSIDFGHHIVASKVVFYEEQGYNLYDETVTVYDDSLNLLWERPLIPDRTELVPSYYQEDQQIHVGNEYITIVGSEDRGNTLPNSWLPVNHLYSTRYTLGGDLVWHRRYDAIDSLLPIYVVEDVDIDRQGNIYAYGYYVHSDPPPCDTCAVIRNTFLLKLDPDGYLNGPPTSTVEEVDAVDNGVRVYPNPATDQITITSDDMIEQVTLHNVDGQVVFTSAAVDELTCSIDLSAYRSGLYLVIVMGASGQVSTTKFVKY